jgi:predicted DNA-binding transcriptional regulator AlpA
MRQDMTMPAIAEVLGVSVATLYRHLPPRPTAPASVRRESLDS